MSKSINADIRINEYLFTVNFDFYTAEKSSHDSPGSDPEVNFNNITLPLSDLDLIGCLSDHILMAIEDKIIEQYKNDQDN